MAEFQYECNQMLQIDESVFMSIINSPIVVRSVVSSEAFLSAMLFQADEIARLLRLFTSYRLRRVNGHIKLVYITVVYIMLVYIMLVYIMLVYIMLVYYTLLFSSLSPNSISRCLFDAAMLLLVFNPFDTRSRLHASQCLLPTNNTLYSLVNFGACSTLFLENLKRLSSVLHTQ